MNWPQMNCTHPNLSGFPLSSSYAHTPTLTDSLHISYRYNIAPASVFEPQTLYFSITQACYPSIASWAVAPGCYHAPGNQRYSHMSQIGVNSYYSWVWRGRRGWRQVKTHLSDNPHLFLSHSPPPVLDIFFTPFTDQWYLTNNTNVIPFPSALCDHKVHFIQRAFRRYGKDTRASVSAPTWLLFSYLWNWFDLLLSVSSGLV